jgi:hypothetical protein
MIEFGSGQGYLKAGFLGFNKSGKTYTASLLAVETRKRMELEAPIALVDTEAGGEYIQARVKAATGKPLIGIKSRSLSDLVAFGQECEKGAASVLIIDSITHIAREVCASYLSSINKARAAKGQPKRNRIEWQDQAIIKPYWDTFSTWYLNSSLHIIICGRAGFNWDFEEEEDDATGRITKKLIKTGVKMKVEADSEFGFEPSLLMEMLRVQIADETSGNFHLMHRVRVLGDRFGVLDGQEQDNPTGEWFDPYLSLLTPGAVNTVDTTLKTDLGVDETGDTEWQRERRERVILAEEVQGEIVKAMPGQSKEEKQAKMILLEKCFGTKSWAAIEAMNSKKLREGLTAVRTELAALAIKPGKVEE